MTNSHEEGEPPEAQPAHPSGRRHSGAYRASVFIRRGVLVTVFLAIGVMLLLYFTRPGPRDFSTPLRDAAAKLPAEMQSGTTLGSANAPLTLTVFEDFQCPFCLQFSAIQEPALIQEYVRTGKLKIVHLNLIRLGAESTQAALAAMCAADQNKYWSYYYRLYLVEADANQYSDERSNVGRFTPEKLKAYASDASLDRAVFDSCLDSGQHSDSIIADQREASRLGINATPGFALAGHSSWVGAPASMADWRKRLDQALASPATAGTN